MSQKMNLRRMTAGRIDGPAAPGEGGYEISGLAVPFNTLSAPIPDAGRVFRERIDARALTWDDRTVMLTQHDHTGVPLARVGSGTMTFENTDEGVRFRATLPESRADVREALERGDLPGDVSIGFLVDDDRWTHAKKGSMRTVTAGHIIELSLVTAGAYKQARIES